MNAGGIRATIPEGPVTLDTIKKVLPHGSELRLVVANGTVIKAMLEHSVEPNEPQGSFLIPCGLRFWWNSAAKPLSRVARVEVRRPCQLLRGTLYGGGVANEVRDSAYVATVEVTDETVAR